MKSYLQGYEDARKQADIPSGCHECPAMTNEDIGRLRGLGKRGYDEILAVLGRQDPARQESH